MAQMTETAEVDMAEQEEQGNSQETKKTVIRATVASLASGAIAYLIRKAAPAIRQKLQSIGENGSVPGAEVLGKAKDAVGGTVEAVTEKLGGGSSGSSKATSSAGKATGSASKTASSAGKAAGSASKAAGSASKSAGSKSKKELETRATERAQNRSKRKKASTTK